ncbi:MAG: dinitrogenase iron-molybdenum cofactor biosynthesis protein [Rhodopseudomonas palustris]|nr:MAG: dinitrogenase iron-molybdenum cofactor biosynthesis protein [Rhodopseudomonas palustris]
MNTLLAIPSKAPGGLDASPSAHFGHCDAFTLVALHDGKIENTSVVPVPEHSKGGCMVPVNLLASHGVTAIAAGGMGQRPLLGFLQVGIKPYFTGAHGSVAEVVSAFIAGGLQQFGQDSCCGGDDSH